MLVATAALLAAAAPPAWAEPPAAEAVFQDGGGLRLAVTVAYVLLLAALCAFGGHRFLMVRLFLRHRRDRIRPARRYADEELPAVTVQLPLFNEGAVAARVIDAAAALDYPRLQVQVLDDSNDGSERIGAERAAFWRGRGVDVVHAHRADRSGYKAGALAAGLQTATGELVAIFDADFVPPAGFLRAAVHFFTDPGIGMVQARWGHLNRDESALTAAQAILLDGHFVVEHTARNRSGVFMHFNGTAGLWRRRCIDDAGGWSHDTLTEDVDLSYRAQLRGWRFLFLPRLVCPAELPREMNAFKTQQHRWTKGSVQTAMKLLPLVFRSDQPLKVKAEAAAHLLSPATYLAVIGFTALCYPAIVMNLRYTPAGAFWGLGVGVLLLCLGTISAATFYVVSQAALGRSAWKTMLRVPLLMALAVGIAVSNAAAVLEALVGHRSGFVRTPKLGGAEAGTEADSGPGPTPRVRVSPAKAVVIAAELGMGLLMLEAARRGLMSGATAISTPFLLLFACGYLYVGSASLWGLRPRTARANAGEAARSAGTERAARREAPPGEAKIAIGREAVAS
ncbi:glycosyltransferase [Phycisphaera mikurensis]|uniref:Putative glycosyltransferase n=1 Tax=Phycisphaera mikurensis (strain NBRC 102666 / KCTC 22515 / FYK2301M01) TaxID=1142394 RepID=I0II95_PHYMF|nr:glycosyltransferase [Phycisphaera mikurensis]MBB6442454.1 cellulose synthase/poly-beta-1,6-N-acetylglucosamine synthase-like glycosyltransferase [Phycisphaera mikurensis]BAM04983.1 putative glycosyltransferase [Phycisphaera mikurensis NBRC 102666]